MDWRLLGQVTVALAAVVTALLRIVPALAERSRSTLMADVEILNAMPKEMSARSSVEQAVHRRISKIYGPRPATSYQEIAKREWGMLLYGAVLLVGFGLWTVYLVSDGFTPWAIATGFGAFSGLSLIVTTFTTEHKPGEDPDKISRGVPQPTS